MSARPYRLLRCTHLHHAPTGTVAWPPDARTTRARRRGKAAYCCPDPACIEDAAEWVKHYTGHSGQYRPFTQQRAS